MSLVTGVVLLLCCTAFCSSLIQFLPNVKEKFGSCPVPLKECVVAPRRDGICTIDDQCSGDLKCCVQNCEYACVEPVIQKAGSCPVLPELCKKPPNLNGICTIDDQCPGDLKCCVQTCEYACVEPVRRKPGSCPADVDYPRCEDSMLSFELECKLDKDCDGERKCCFSGCKRQCLLPLGAKNGYCPYFDNAVCVHIKPSRYECHDDNQCQGTDRCCYYGCRMQCKATLTVKPGQCPIPLTLCVSDTLPPPLCKSDSECEGKKKCCIKFCRRECYDPRP